MTAPTGPFGVLISNLGTPEAPTPAAVRRYLAEFLSDRRVIALSPILWQPILHGFVLRIRPRRSARLYQKIWTEHGSPLLYHSQQQRDALEQELHNRGHSVRVALGMRYGHPSISEALEELGSVESLIVLPLYPQFSDTTTASTFDVLHKTLERDPSMPHISLIAGYANEEGYIHACATRIREHMSECDSQTRLLLSFHGLPAESEKHDPYAQQCRRSAKQIADTLGLAEDQWGLGFQSRFGPKEWLKPYTDDVLRQWAGRGMQNVFVFCPGFAADCLETLEEIAQQSREVFLAARGQAFYYIPALNDHPQHIQALANLVCRHLN